VSANFNNLLLRHGVLLTNPTLTLAHTVSEAMAQNRVFMYEPNLIANLADVIHPEKNAPLVSNNQPSNVLKMCIVTDTLCLTTIDRSSGRIVRFGCYCETQK
jgi:hypothetical protein